MQGFSPKTGVDWNPVCHPESIRECVSFFLSPAHQSACLGLQVRKYQFNKLKQYGNVFRKKSRSRPALELLNSSSKTQLLSISLLYHSLRTALFSEVGFPEGYKDGCYISRCHRQTLQYLVEEKVNLFQYIALFKRKKKKPFSRSPFISHCPERVHMPNHDQSQGGE